ncbi:short-chain dehydrogenase [Streptomyces radicis]|nr:short-chain dehydrogenase [Streptomyces radicis]
MTEAGAVTDARTVTDAGTGPVTESRHENAPGTGNEVENDAAVAVVGMAGRFPGADDVGELWRNLLAGASGLREITDAELAAAGADLGPGHVRVGGPVAGIEEFDAVAFGLSDREAETMEPHHRLLLECAWEALESAGYPPTDPGVPVGVFAGCAFPDYLTHHVPDLAQQPDGGRLLAAGVERDSLTSFISWKLGLRGPSLTVQTYCSTSLVAVHLACQSLLTYECDMALAGGAHLPLPQAAGYRHEEGGILSPDGRVASLDASANGTVMGSGAALVALKRLADAVADGDVVHAVILGSAVNNDGRERAGYAAPGAAGQAAVVETAQAVAGVKPESIGYVECHAVGTPLGDSVELAALARVFGTPRDEPCVLGSAKPLIGHLDRAAGVTGLLRAALSLRDRVLPATAGFTAPNPALAAAGGRLVVLAENRPWPAGAEPRRAGVSSFGVGGTNAHVVLQEPPLAPAVAPRPGPHLLTLSAAGPEALSAATRRLGAYLAEHPGADLADVAHTLQVSRGRFALRRAVVVRDHEDAVAALADPDRWIEGETRRRDPRVRVTGGESPELVTAARRLLGTESVASGLRRIGVLVADDGTEEVAIDGVGGVGVGAAGVGAAGVGAFGVGGAGVGGEGAGRDGVDVWLLTVLARLWLAGAVLDWAALHGGAGRRVALPTYPFQRRRHWMEPGATGAPNAPGVLLPSWQRRPLPVADLDRRLRLAGPWLLLGAGERAEALRERLIGAGAEVVAIRRGAAFAAHASGDFTVARPDDAPLLARSLIAVPRTVAHAFALGPPGAGGAADDAEAWIAALAGEPVLADARPVVFTGGALGVLGPDLTRPEHSALAEGAPNAVQVDLDPGADMDQALAAALTDGAGPLAVRGGGVWESAFRECELPDPTPVSGLNVLLVGDDEAAAGWLADAGANVVRARPGEAVTPHQRVDAAVLSPATVDGFHALQAALGDRAPRARVALAPRGAVAAHARAARLRGAGRWIVAEGERAHAALDRLLAAADHLDHVVIGGDPPREAHGAERAEGPGRSRPGTGARASRPRPALATPLVEPGTDRERAVAELWCAGLGLAEVGVDDNFFELGGRSAAAVGIATRLAEAHSVELPLTALVEYPTVRQLAAYVEELGG